MPRNTTLSAGLAFLLSLLIVAGTAAGLPYFLDLKRLGDTPVVITTAEKLCNQQKC